MGWGCWWRWAPSRLNCTPGAAFTVVSNLPYRVKINLRAFYLIPGAMLLSHIKLDFLLDMLQSGYTLCLQVLCHACSAASVGVVACHQGRCGGYSEQRSRALSPNGEGDLKSSPLSCPRSASVFHHTAISTKHDNAGTYQAQL